jgi:rhodanese-related sulfurtransferase
MKKICPNKINEIANRERLIVDVRENFEFQNYRIDVQNMINIPLSEIEQKINEFPNDREVILVCNNGLRSKDGSQIFRTKRFQ